MRSTILLTALVAGLNNAGFSRKDYRTADTLPIIETETTVPEPQPEQTTMQFAPEPKPEAETEDDFSDIHTPVEPAPYSETVKTAPPSVEEMISQAEEQRNNTKKKQSKKAFG